MNDYSDSTPVEAEIVPPAAVSPFDDLDLLTQAAEQLLVPALSELSTMDVALDDIMERANPNNPTPSAPLWHILIDEPPEAYQAFVLWLRLPLPRTFAAIARELPHSASRIANWAGEYLWESRARAWVLHQQHLYEAAYTALVHQSAKRDVENTSKVIAALMEPTNQLLRTLADDDKRAAWVEKVGNLPPDKLLRLVSQTATHIPKVLQAQRLALGLPTSISLSEEHVVDDTQPANRDQVAEVLRQLGFTGALDDTLGIERTGESADPETE